MTATDRPRQWRRIVLHVMRASLFVLVLVLIHVQHARIEAHLQSEPLAPVESDRLRRFFPDAQEIADAGQGRREVLDASGETVGYVVQTSPGGDHLVGFSGPTNVLIACGRDDRIVGIDILSSKDTREHVAQVLRDDSFLHAFNGMTWDETAHADVDAVSGATLTSRAIQEAIIHRLSGSRPSLRFPDPLTVADARAVFEQANAVERDETWLSLWHVKNEQGQMIGSLLRTTPFADNLVGYQGPTETHIGFDLRGQIVGISLGKSYDNEEYVTYVREDEYFRSLFNDLKLEELARLDLQEAEVEGVSGATMTSMAVAKGLVAAAEQQRQALEAAARPPEPVLKWTLRDLGTAAAIVVGLTIALTPLRGKKFLRIGFQLALIVYLGLINGDMLSQAMLVGWAQTGVPWSKAGGLILLTAAAFLVPLTTRSNAYCTHLCPHGAAQQLLKNLLPWQLHLPHWLFRVLRIVPAVLLLWCIAVALASLPFSLVDIEPFDAWVFSVAGWATTTVAVVGLIASLFVPMAYCRYGCPTGALLNYLRFNARSDRLSPRDWLAVALVGFAFALWTVA